MTRVLCQRWAEQLPLWTVADPGERFDSRAYEVHPIAKDGPAKEFVLRHHYSASYPNAKRRYGLFRDGALVGVAVYAVPLQKAVLTGPLPDLEPYVESVELSRFVLLDPEPGNAESWFLARCHEALAAVDVRGVVSFSDPVPRPAFGGEPAMPGHIGVIYQASNAVYTGRATARVLATLPDGTVMNDRAIQKIRKQEQGHEYAERLLVAHGARPMRSGEKPAVWLKTALDEAAARRLRHDGCHRYVFRLGRTRRERERVRVALPGLPYPKRHDGP